MLRQSLRIGYVSNSKIPSHWANSVQTMKMCDAFVGKGAQVELIVPWFWGAMRQNQIDILNHYAIRHDFRITWLPYPHIGLRFQTRGWGISASVYAYLRRFDIVYTWNVWTAYWLARWGRQVIWEAHNFSEERRYPIFAILVSELLGKPNMRGLVAVSHQLGETYIQAGAPFEKVLIAQNGVDLDRFQPKLDKRQARLKLNLPLDSPIACHLGQLYEHRGIEELLECASYLPNVYFVLVGGDSVDIERYRLMAEKLGIRNICFAGYIPNGDVPSYLYASDVLVMPYTSKLPTVDCMSPMKMFDYMAAGRAIVATDFPTIREVLSHEHNAILVEPDSTDALCHGIRRVLEDCGLAERITQQARHDVEKYTWDNRVTAILDTFIT